MNGNQESDKKKALRRWEGEGGALGSVTETSPNASAQLPFWPGKVEKSNLMEAVVCLGDFMQRIQDAPIRHPR